MELEKFRAKLLTEGLKTVGALPNERQMEWYRREKMIFFHFGINTFTDREWGDGTEDPSLFNPSALDCRQWIRIIKEAGFNMAILTAKHHDGFCLWPSKYTEHSIKNSPYKNGKGDIVREFTDACREYGIKAGIYLSPWDRHESTWGTDAYNDYYDNQLHELLTNYGEIFECWWDGAGSTEATYDWERWANTVRTLQPKAIIFGSLGATPFVDSRWVGNERGFAGKPCYATIDKSALYTEHTPTLTAGVLGGDSFIPAEADVSIRPGWFYHKSQDENVRSAANLFNLWLYSVGRNSTLLLNLPPNPQGLISDADAQSLSEFALQLKSGLAKNLASDASVKASSVFGDAYAPENMLNENEESFFAPKEGDEIPEIVFELGHQTEFNAVELDELIELGHHVTSFEVYARVRGEWRKLYENKCMGFRSIERIMPITADAVKVRITGFIATPLIRKFALYRFDDIKEPEISVSNRKNLIQGEACTVERLGDEFDINFGGIFPFDTIIIKGAKRFDIKVFNGTSFVNVAECTDSDTYKFFKPISWSYRVKLTVLDKDEGELIPEIY